MSEPSPSASASLEERAAELARRWAAAAPGAAPQDERLAAVIGDAGGRRFALDLTDAVMRTESLRAAALRLRESGTVPPSLPWLFRGTLRATSGLAHVLPAPAVPIARRMLREVLRPLVVDARRAKIEAEIARVRGDDDATAPSASGRVRLELVRLGETVLGEAGAARRLSAIHELIRRDDVDQVAVDVRSVVRPASEWAFDERVADAAAKLAPLYATAATNGVIITLDVAEHDDLDLTIAVFTRLLEDPRLLAMAAGISLPASLPDALPALEELSAWSESRVDQGGTPITVRLRSGAAIAAERAKAALHGWTPATHETDIDAAAALLRCLDRALRPERTRAVRIGVGGADLGIAAYAWLLAQERGVADALELDLLLGQDPGRVRVLARETGAVLLRAPVVDPGEFDITIGQWIRLLDADAPSAADSGKRLLSALLRSTEASLRTTPRRTQNRLAPVHESVRSPAQAPDPEEQLTKAVLGISRGSEDQPFLETAVYSAREIDADAGGAPGFANAPDTDPSLAANREWARQVFARIAAESENPPAATRAVADQETVRALLMRTRESGIQWGSRPASERADVLHRAAAALEGNRGELIAIAAAETGLLLPEGDAEVSRAADSARYYAITARELDAVAGAAFEPAALTVACSSWRAPIAEPADAALAALAAGSAVVLVPAPQALRSASAMAEVLWQAGVPRDALVVADTGLDTALVSIDDVDLVLLSGSRDDAARIRAHRPGLSLLAETAGRNAAIVTASADLDQAAADLVRSAFARGGQAATAVSAVILVGPAGRSKRFARQLADAARSLRAGWPADPAAQVGPLIERPDGAAERSLTRLDDEEEWLVRPRAVGADESGRLWRPGIRVGARPERLSERVTGAVPVLDVMHAPTLEAAIDLHNDIACGLVAALHAHDPAELGLWLERVEAGMLFVNRDTTGSVVQRRPSGGWKHSSLGGGAKSGGPNRLIGLGSWHPRRSVAQSSTLHLRGLDSRITALIEAAQPSLGYEEFEWLRRAALSDALAWDREFGRVRDVSRLGVERNLLRYRPVPVEIRVAADARLHDLLRVVIAAVRAGSAFVLSITDGLPAGVRHALTDLQASVYLESDAEWLERGLRHSAAEGEGGLFGLPRADRVRLVGGADAVAGLRAQLIGAASGADEVSVHDGEVTPAGRIELLTFVREQSITITAHRHGAPDDWSAAVI
jgi:RHH-type proline utilization regulon transcriptional repressor/proline dehydrogenase/delta 1-pyrroline-5-carboxylate dehydrogenase